MVTGIQDDYTLKAFHCPHCKRFLFNGNFQKLNMTCPHCNQMITVDEGPRKEDPKGNFIT